MGRIFPRDLTLSEKAILFFIFIAGLLFVIAVPPFQKPDENVHFYRSIALAKGQFFCITRDNKTFFEIPKIVKDYPSKHHMENIAFKYGTKYPKSILSDKHVVNKDQLTQLVPFLEWCNLAFIGYIPNAAGSGLGLLSKNLLFTFYTGRIFGFMFFLLTLLLSLRYVPKELRRVLLFYASIPMLLHQVTAYSYDVVQFSVVTLVFALFTRFFMIKKIKIYEYLLFVTSVLIFVSVKPGYYGFYLLPFLIPGKLLPLQTSSRRIFFTVVGVVFFANSLLWIKQPPSNANYPVHTMPNLQIKNIIEDPFNYVVVLFNTVFKYDEFYTKSFLGFLGWLDYAMSFYAYSTYLIVLGFIIRSTLQNKEINISFRSAGILAIVILTTVILVFSALYVFYTPVGFNTVDGVQGRYFIPLLPFVVIVAIKLLRFKLIQATVVFALAILIVVNLVKSIYLRYYDYSRANIVESVDLIGTEEKTIYITKELKVRLQLSEDTEKLVGFYFYVDKVSRRKAAYTYNISTKNCKTTFIKGYLQNIHLAPEETIYVENIKPIEPKNEEMCLTIKSIVPGKFIRIKSINGEFVKPILSR